MFRFCRNSKRGAGGSPISSSTFTFSSRGASGSLHGYNRLLKSTGESTYIQQIDFHHPLFQFLMALWAPRAPCSVRGTGGSTPSRPTRLPLRLGVWDAGVGPQPPVWAEVVKHLDIQNKLPAIRRTDSRATPESCKCFAKRQHPSRRIVSKDILRLHRRCDKR